MNHYDSLISLYSNLEEKTPKQTKVSAVLAKIKSPVPEDVLQARAAGKGSELYEKVKLSQQFVSWNTLFRGEKGKGLGSPTQIIYSDVDGLENSTIEHLEKLKEQLGRLPYVIAAWVSFGGKGLGFISAADGLTLDTFSEFYYKISYDCSEIGIILDPACSNHNRGNFLSFDLNLRIFNDFKPLSLGKVEFAEKRVYSSDPFKALNTSEKIHRECEILLQNNGWSKGNRRNYWARPGRPASHVSAIFDDAGGRYPYKLKNFTSEAAPFEANTMYSHYDILLLLKYAGDEKAAQKYVFDNFGQKTEKREKLSEKDLIAKISEDFVLYSEVKIYDFPKADFPEHLAALAEYDYNINNTPVEWSLSSMLMLIGLATFKRVKLKVTNTWTEYGVLWVALAGKAGDGKTHTMNRYTKEFRVIQNEIDTRYEIEKEKAEQEAAKWEKMSKADRDLFGNNAPEPDKVFRKNLFATSGTMEGLHASMRQNNSSLGVFSDELLGFFKNFGAYKGGGGDDMEAALSMWSYSGGSSRKLLASKDAQILNTPFIPILGGIQISTFLEYMRKNGMENGLFERILYAKPKQYEYKPRVWEDVPPEYLEYWGERIRDVYNTFAELPENFVYKFDDSTLKIRQEFNKWVTNEKIKADKGNKPKIGELLAKIETYSFRIALNLAVLFDSCNGALIRNNIISLDVYRAAIRIARYYYSTASAILDSSTTDTADLHTLSARELTAHKKNIAYTALSQIPPEHKRRENVIVATIVNNVIGKKGQVSASNIGTWKNRKKLKYLYYG